MKNKAQSRTELFEIRKLNRTALALTCITQILIKLVSKAVRSNSVQFGLVHIPRHHSAVNCIA